MSKHNLNGRNQELGVATEHVVGLAGGDHPRPAEAAEAANADDHPELGDLADAEGDRGLGLPEVDWASSQGR